MKLVFATNNANKIKEVQALLPTTISLVSLSDIGCFEDIPETSPSIEGNAIQKAKYVTEKYGHPCFADDTGLEVHALDGAPGVYSARYAGQAKSAEANITKLLEELEGKTDRTAQFKTVVALQTNTNLHCFTGVCKGEITTARRGDSGFGYDSIFQPEEHGTTFAEMALSLKNKIGHRGKAVAQLIAFLEHYQD